MAQTGFTDDNTFLSPSTIWHELWMMFGRPTEEQQSRYYVLVDAITPTHSRGKE